MIKRFHKELGMKPCGYQHIRDSKKNYLLEVETATAINIVQAINFLSLEL